MSRRRARFLGVAVGLATFAAGAGSAQAAITVTRSELNGTQLRVEGSGFSKRGDSGAVAFGESGGLAGMVFYGDDAATTYLNPMSEVLSGLGVTAQPVPCGGSGCTQLPPPPALRELRRLLKKK